MKKILVLLPTLYSIFFVLVLPVHAQSTALSISPPVIEILIAPNKKVSQTFNLKYQGSGLKIIPELHLVVPSDAYGHVNVDPNPLDLSSIPLVVTSVGHPFGEPIEAEGGVLPITLTFEAPTVDVAADVYLALVLKAVGKDEFVNASTTSPAISALILASINPSGVMPIDLEVQDFSPPYLHDSWLPLTISPIIINHVPVMIRPKGKYEVISPSGKTVFSLDLYPSLILGDSQRAILGSNKDQPPIPLTWSPSWTHIGPYRLHLTITTIGGTKLTDVEKVVWILPIRAFAILLLLTITVSLNIIMIRRRKKIQISNH